MRPMGSRTRRGARFQRAVSPIVATCPPGKPAAPTDSPSKRWNVRHISYAKVRPQIEDGELARVAAGAPLWAASQAIVWALAGDAFGNGDDPFQLKLEIFRLGRRPISLENETLDQEVFVIL